MLLEMGKKLSHLPIEFKERGEIVPHAIFIPHTIPS